MMDLLDVTSPVQPAPSPDKYGPDYPSAIAYDSSALKIMFDFSKPPGTPQTMHIKATFLNKSSQYLHRFHFSSSSSQNTLFPQNSQSVAASPPII
ncbi:unnamed protein product [Rhodiola kirilowii]